MNRRLPASPVAQAAAAARRRSVFINCPFDDEFQPLLDTLIFAVVCSDFEPHSATEGLAGSTPRISRIVQRLRDSELSIHDLSRYKGVQPEYLARFNMPLELGMAIEMKHAHERGETPLPHDWLALAPAEMPLAKVVSDLGAFEVEPYEDRGKLAMTALFWLRERRRELGLRRPRLDVQAALDALDHFVDAELKKRPAGADARKLWHETVTLAEANLRTLLAQSRTAATSGAATASSPAAA